MGENPVDFRFPDSPKSKEFIAWLWSQMEGIASGLCEIHVNSQKSQEDSRSLGEGAQSGPSPSIEPTFLDPEVEYQNKQEKPVTTGYHHDIKPENILHFPQNMVAEIKTPIPRHGILQIADFGIGKFHSELSGTGTGTFRGTVTYSAPESKVPRLEAIKHGRVSAGGLKVSRPYDVWSFGCVLMEVLIWVVFGVEGRNKFRGDRTGPAEEDDFSNQNDAFFYLKKSREPHIREAVSDWLEKLRNHPRIKDQSQGSLAEVLKLVKEVLNIDPVKRMSAQDVSGRLAVITEIARVTADDGLDTIAEVPSHESGADFKATPPIRVDTYRTVDAEIAASSPTRKSIESQSQGTVTLASRPRHESTSSKPPSTSTGKFSRPGTPDLWGEGHPRTDSDASPKSANSKSSMTVQRSETRTSNEYM